MAVATAQPRATIPRWLTIVFTLFVAVLVPVYYREYGPANFLWFCDAGLLLTAIGLWLRSPLLISVNAIALAIPQTLWVLDFLAGGHLVGFSTYMFNPSLGFFTRILSTFHIWLPVLLVLLTWRMGYDRRALWVQSLIATGLLLGCYLLTDPRHPPSGFPNAAVNVNRVYGLQPAKAQTWMPPLFYLGIQLVFYPICVYLPAHLLFRRIFRPPLHSYAAPVPETVESAAD